MYILVVYDCDLPLDRNNGEVSVGIFVIVFALQIQRMKHIIASVIILILVVQLVSCSRDPKEWKLVRSAKADELVSFHVALHQRNTDLLEKHLYEVSDPTHPRYGEEMTREQIMSLIAPPKQDHDAVVNWFTSYGTSVKIHSFGDALKITAPSHLVEKMLNTRLYKYQHVMKSHVHAIRQVGGFTIPSEISSKIYMITGLTMFPYVRRDVKTKYNDNVALAEEGHEVLARDLSQTDPYPYVSVSNLRSLYNVPPGTAAQSPKTTQMAMEFSGIDAPIFGDLLNFTTLSKEVFTNYSQVFGPFTADGGDESTLDVELLMGLGSKVANWYYTVANGWIYEMALELFSLKEAPQVVSISYGWPEIDSCDSSVTTANCNGITVAQYVNRSNIELVKVGLRRVSVLVASGDQGAAGNTNDDCSNTTHPVFAIYPAASPYVTTISGTTLQPASITDKPETVRNVAPDDLPICNLGYKCVSEPVVEWPCMANNTYYQWTTGGGFSEISSMPSYQAAVVQKYLRTPNLFIPPSQYFNAANRAYPDFSAVGSRLLNIEYAAVMIGAGTSAATPIAAATISLLNDARAQVNKKPLGFLNPMLYKMYSDNPATFNDVTMGDNHCSDQDICCTYGYGATKGWDAVTGLGTPNFVAMRKYVTSNLP